MSRKTKFIIVALVIGMMSVIGTMYLLQYTLSIKSPLGIIGSIAFGIWMLYVTGDLLIGSEEKGDNHNG